ncbi:hypothetical protein B296_00039680 [Ensete ventricosum]|uniref:Uncharacterized protein n=1 Tax=Ensete ventricosum TaxID=4639 RepID=A0A426Y5M5_ENSVE|nr:hypothetical protein B296_00039680 [Ensete ventricosum]
MMQDPPLETQSEAPLAVPGKSTTHHLEAEHAPREPNTLSSDLTSSQSTTSLGEPMTGQGANGVHQIEGRNERKLEGRLTIRSRDTRQANPS